jgi:hypothetical protein
MKYFRLVVFLRVPIRLLIGALALLTGLSHGPHISAAGNSPAPDPLAIPPTVALPQFGCGDGGDGGDGGDICAYTSMCSYFCPCNCYYGFYGSYGC